MVGGGLVEFVFRIGISWLLARALGATGYGMYSLVVGVAGLVAGLGGLGLDDAMVRYLAIQSTRDDRAGMRGTLQIGIVGSLVVGVLAGAGLFLAADWVGGTVFHDPGLVRLLQIMGGVVPFLLLSNTLLGVVRGFNRMDYAAFAENVIQSIVRFALVAVLWFTGLDVLLAVVAFAVADMSASVVLAVMVRRLVRRAHAVDEPPRRDTGDVVGFALPLWMSGLLNRFRRNIETFALGALSIAADVGIFTVAARVNFISHMVYRAVVVAVKPLLARAFAEGDREALARVYSVGTRWTLTLNLPFFLVMVLYPVEILSIFGPDFTVGASAFVVLAFSELTLSATGTCGSMIDMAGHTRIKVFNSILWVGAAVAGSIVFIPPLGVLGAAVGSMLAVLLVNVVRTVEVWILDGLQPFRRDFWKPAVAATTAGALGLVMRVVFGAGTVLAAGAQGAVVVATYAGFLVLFGIHDEDRMILDRVKRKVVARAGIGRSS